MCYTLAQIEKEFIDICNSQNIDVYVPIEINYRLSRALGRLCFTIDKNQECHPLKVQFSKKFLDTATDDSVANVIKHEACHYILMVLTHKDHGHDEKFKALCARVGCENVGPEYQVERTQPASKVYKYQVYCPTCDEFIAEYHRMCSTLQHINHCECNKCHNRGLVLMKNW